MQRFDPDGDIFENPLLPPVGHPSPELLHYAATHGNTNSSAGRDGWLPAELKWLPLRAWKLRHHVLALSLKLRRFPSQYREVTVASIPRGDGCPAPMKQRLRTIFPALYRIEAKARFRMLAPWL